MSKHGAASGAVIPVGFAGGFLLLGQESWASPAHPKNTLDDSWGHPRTGQVLHRETPSSSLSWTGPACFLSSAVANSDTFSREKAEAVSLGAAGMLSVNHRWRGLSLAGVQVAECGGSPTYTYLYLHTVCLVWEAAQLPFFISECLQSREEHESCGFCLLKAGRGMHV